MDYNRESSNNQFDSEIANTTKNALKAPKDIKDTAENIKNTAHKIKDKIDEHKEKNDEKRNVNNTQGKGMSAETGNDKGLKNNNDKKTETKHAENKERGSGVAQTGSDNSKNAKNENNPLSSLSTSTSSTQSNKGLQNKNGSKNGNSKKSDALKNATKPNNGTSELAKNSFETLSKAGSPAIKIAAKVAAGAASGGGGSKVATTIGTFLLLGCTFVVYIADQAIAVVTAPIRWLVGAVTSAAEGIGDFLNDIGNSEPTWAETSQFVIGFIRGGLKTACNTTCYREVYQIAEENGYDIEETMKSFEEATVPYIFEENYTNVNYSEILAVISLSKDFQLDNFNYLKFKQLFDDQEFLRCLYDLKIEEKQKLVINEGALAEGETFRENDDGSVTIIKQDGTTTTYHGENEYCTLKEYIDVKIDKYPLKKLFDYFGIDPHAACEQLPTYTNFQVIPVCQNTTRLYDESVYWGSAETSQLIDYEYYTGKISNDYTSTYYKDFLSTVQMEEGRVYISVERFKQAGASAEQLALGDVDWKNEYLRSGNKYPFPKYGCYMSCIAMVTNSFAKERVTPYTILNFFRENTNADPIIDVAGHEYGFHAAATCAKWDSYLACGELKNKRLLIAHLKPGARGSNPVHGHYVVINGFNNVGGEGYFYITEPAGRCKETESFAECNEIFEFFSSYELDEIPQESE